MKVELTLELNIRFVEWPDTRGFPRIANINTGNRNQPTLAPHSTCNRL